MLASAGRAASGAVSRTTRADHAENCEEKNRNVTVVACARMLAALLWDVQANPSAMQNQERCEPSTLGCECVQPVNDEVAESPRERHARHNMDKEGQDHCLHSLKFWKPMAWQRSPLFPRGRGPCLTEKGRIPSTTNSKRLPPCWPTHELLKKKNRKDILNLS